MPEPLAIPPIVIVRPPIRALAAASLGLRSVVRIARAASCPPDRRARAISEGIPSRTRAIGSGCPMTPVEPTKTVCGFTPRRRATRVVISSASAIPCGPVHAFALPLLIITAWPTPPRRCNRSSCTGAAGRRFIVKTPAIGPGSEETINARSRIEDFLMPQ